MSLPIIIASNISTNEPEEIIIFDKWWIENLNVTGDQNGNIRGSVILAKFGIKSDGTMVFNGEKTNLVIQDILQESSQNQVLANAMAGIISYVGQKAISEGVAASVIGLTNSTNP